MDNMRTNHYLSNFLISMFTALFLLSTVFYSFVYFSLNVLEILVLIFVSSALYALLIYVLLLTSRRVIYRKRPLPNEPKKISDNEIINAIVNEVYSDEEEKALVKVGFVGNSKTKMYHKVECKLAGKVEAEYRLENNSEEFFKRRKFKKCKVCFKK